MKGKFPEYFVEQDEFIRADFLNQADGTVGERVIPGPHLVRISSEAEQPRIGHIIQMQIGFNRGHEVMVAPKFEDTVFKSD